MKDRLLERADVNVIIVDWGRGSGPPYNQAVANIRMVGYMTARLLYHMKIGRRQKQLFLFGLKKKC